MLRLVANVIARRWPRSNEFFKVGPPRFNVRTSVMHLVDLSSKFRQEPATHSVQLTPCVLCRMSSGSFVQALPLNGGLGTVGLVSQKGNKMQPNQARFMSGLILQAFLREGTNQTDCTDHRLWRHFQGSVRTAMCMMLPR